MKFFHVSDLHFGKTLYDVQLVDEDQPYWVEQFLKAVDEHQPDAILIAGDIYDRKQPSDEAIKLFEHMISELAARNKKVFVVPGNHDSCVRLSQFNEFLRTKDIYIARDVKKVMNHHEVDGVVFWLMPYVYPLIVSDSSVLDDPSLVSFDQAARALIDAQDIDTTKCNVIISHQNVIANGVKPEHSDSETTRGGLGEIEYTAYDKFDYVALGHIHNGQKVGRGTVRYSGCPLYYDFSEINRDKRVVMVEVNKDGRITDDDISFIEIPLLHTLHIESGSVEDLIKNGRALQDKEKYYVLCNIEDRNITSDDRNRISAVYGSCLVHVTKSEEISASGTASQERRTGLTEKVSIDKAFSDFYYEKTGDFLNGVQESLIKKIIEQQDRNAGSYLSLSGKDGGKKLEEETDELVKFLVDASEKAEKNGEERV